MKTNQTGAINVLLLPVILLSILFLGAAGFGFWAFNSRQDYKNNSDAKVQAAVAVAQQQTSTAKDNEFANKEKQPLKTYNGPSAYGSVVLQYPKTWSGYVVQNDNGGGTALDGYFYPGIVPSINDQGKAFALRFQVVSRSYTDVLKEVQNLDKNMVITSYALPKVPSTVGVMAKGQIAQNKTGSMVVLPMRDKTLKIWTEGTDFQSDFDNLILANFSFQP